MKVLLAHPNINVNLKTRGGSTSLSLSWDGHVSVVRVLIMDPRVDVALEDHHERFPVWCSSWGGHHKVIE